MMLLNDKEIGLVYISELKNGDVLKYEEKETVYEIKCNDGNYIESYRKTIETEGILKNLGYREMFCYVSYTRTLDINKPIHLKDFIIPPHTIKIVKIISEAVTIKKKIAVKKHWWSNVKLEDI